MQCTPASRREIIYLRFKEGNNNRVQGSTASQEGGARRKESRRQKRLSENLYIFGLRLRTIKVTPDVIRK